MRGFSVVLALLILGQPAVAADAPRQRQWTIDGVERQGLIFAPKSADNNESPVIFAFHGHGGTARHAARTFAYQEHWPEAIVVYMQGLPTPGMTDPQGKLPGWQRTTGDQGDRDLKFFDQVLASLKKDHKVDTRRIYATGHSNGGAFTYLLWAARGEVFAAVAPSAAGTRQVRSLKPKPALHVAGEKDELVSFEVQKRMIEAVRQINGCDAEGTPWAKSGPITGTQYASKEGTPLVTLIYPGTHKFPAEAPALIVKFFKEHPR